MPPSSSLGTVSALLLVAGAATSMAMLTWIVASSSTSRRRDEHKNPRPDNDIRQRGGGGEEIQENDNDKEKEELASLRRALQIAEERRKEERTGRIRAEVRLRQVSKQLEKMEQSVETTTTAATTPGNNNSSNDTTTTISTMRLQSIGHVTSPYTKRMGTPRQPQLVPSSRGFIEFTCPAATLDGITDYSHIWILFEFHANTNIIDNKSKNNKKTKIRPPRANGIKVGQLATRSPHRPNCLGLSLVQVHSWDASTRRLHVRGLDLVHGTPVYDIKPCVPWDIPATTLRVPAWVSQTDDALAKVEFTTQAEADLQRCINVEQRLAPLYTKNNDEDEDDDVQATKQTLQEILAQDPRSSHKGLKKNARGTITASTSLDTASSNNSNSGDDAKISNGQGGVIVDKKDESLYNLIFGQCQVFFRVEQDRGVVVSHIDGIDFEQDTTTFADGVPLILASEKKISTTS